MLSSKCLSEFHPRNGSKTEDVEDHRQALERTRFGQSGASFGVRIDSLRGASSASATHRGAGSKAQSSFFKRICSRRIERVLAPQNGVWLKQSGLCIYLLCLEPS